MTALDDTSRCPLGVRCESCGVEGEGLDVETADLGRLGVACLTMCRRCAASSRAPPVSVSTAARLVMQHALHLGITADDMAELQERGCSACREVGPLLTAPGTSGRSWRCECGAVWSHGVPSRA